jgi:hypothetical protein
LTVGKSLGGQLDGVCMNSNWSDVTRLLVRSHLLVIHRTGRQSLLPYLQLPCGMPIGPMGASEIDSEHTVVTR